MYFYPSFNFYLKPLTRPLNSHPHQQSTFYLIALKKSLITSSHLTERFRGLDFIIALDLFLCSLTYLYHLSGQKLWPSSQAPFL